VVMKKIPKGLCVTAPFILVDGGLHFIPDCLSRPRYCQWAGR
jgi:hypothetical protein